jgi:glycolate oxidase
MGYKTEELTNEEYTALEDVVGTDFITREPAIRDTYNQVWMNKLIFDQKWSNRPSAVVLPSTTEEVQGIVRVCNRYRIPFKPIATGWEMVMALVSERGIIIDLKRMNKILEIDTKNMHAVVEPYVSTHLLQRETAKYGLRIGNVGAGPNPSVVALTCCHFGGGPTALSTGGPGRNTLGVEWVLPTGDVLRMGTAEAGNGWFSADGPGLSLRGILRGHSGANGGHGIITKACTKLYPWYGPPEYELVGRLPGQKRFAKVLEGYKVLDITYPTEENTVESAREICQAEIAVSARQMAFAFGGEGNDETWENAQKMDKGIAEMCGRTLQVILGANSAREMEYKEACALEISKKRGGELKPELNDPDLLAVVFGATLWGFGGSNRFRAAGDCHFTPALDGSFDWAWNEHKTFRETIKPYWDRGDIAQGPTPFVYQVPENISSGAHAEGAIQYNPFDPDSLKAAREIRSAVTDPEGKFKRYGVPAFGAGFQWEPVDHIHQRFGPLYDNYDIWLRKIKAMLDPNNVADWGAYIPPSYPE